MAKKNKAAYMISAVAEQYQIHPQTLRLYEREGLLKPSRSEGNTRLYTDQDLERLEVILKLTRDLGVNLAGVEIILNMRERMAEMQHQIEQFVTSLNDEISQRSRQTIPEPAYSLIPVIEARRPKKYPHTEQAVRHERAFANVTAPAAPRLVCKSRASVRSSGTTFPVAPPTPFLPRLPSAKPHRKPFSCPSPRRMRRRANRPRR